MTFPNSGYAPWILTGEDGIIVSQTGIHVTISGAGIPAFLGQTFFAELDTDESISTAPPTASFLYGPGQPSVLLAMAEPIRAGRTRITATFNGYLFNDDPPNENQPFVDVGVFVDGVLVGRANESFFFATATPPEITVMPFTGAIDLVVTVADSPVIEIRWGVTGGGPHATGTVLAGTSMAPDMNVHYATLVAQELPP